MAETPLPLAAVFSIEGETLTHAEKTLFSASQPFGFILFGRNCSSPEQVRRLTNEVRSCVGWDCPIMIDQEGGRVARLKSPNWDVHPAARYFGEKIERDGECNRLRQDMTDLAKMLLREGIDVNCAPVCDVLTEATHNVIGDRAYSHDPEIVARAAEVTSLAFLDAGVTPILKHIPGHGRASVDSHHNLPVVDATLDEMIQTDFLPFMKICEKPFSASCWAMVAHIIYKNIDPDLPATLSKIVITKIIRELIGFNGLLFSDDLDMKALENYGSIAERANLSLQAGCDLALYCWAKIDVMERLAAELPPLSSKGWDRWQLSRTASWSAEVLA